MHEVLLNNESFASWLDAQASAAGLEAVACLELDSLRSERLDERYSDAALAGMPSYVLRDRRFKIDPSAFAPWAKSVLVGVGSFRSLPSAPGTELFKFVDPESPFAGLTSGYSFRLDYHLFAREAMKKIALALAALAGENFRFESLCDSNPLPERSFAAIAGLGLPGLHRCLLAQATRDGVFIGILLSELSLPERRFADDPSSWCNHCGACVGACPSGALGSDGSFDCSRCVQYIGAELRGPLSQIQTKLLGRWLSGCGECVRECPRSKMPPPLAVDLEWLLTCPASELDRALRLTPQAHEGATLLRRNALAVLANQDLPECRALISRFKEKTGSVVLRSFAESLLAGKP